MASVIDLVRIRLLLVVALVAAALALLAPAPVSAGTYSLDFDALANNTVVSSGPGGLTIPLNPKVFDATGKTQSGTMALRRAGDCPNSGPLCTTGNHRLEFRFESGKEARSLSVRVGTVVPYSCFEFDCPSVQLVGYNASGGIVASTPRTYVGGASLTHPLSIDAFAYSIRKVVLVFSGNPLTGFRESGDGHQYTAQLDNLTYRVDEGDGLPPLPPPAPPTVEITSPGPGELFASTDAPVTGEVNAPAGLAEFCVVANRGATIPTSCNRTAQVDGDGSFDFRRISGMRPGNNEVRAWVRDSLGRVTSASATVRVVDGAVDILTESIEVTQAVQVERLPQPNSFTTLPGLPTAPAEAYDGVPLAEEKMTIARVYGAARGADVPVRGTEALLRGYERAPGTPTGWRELPESPLRPHFSPATLQADPDLAVLRAASDGSFNFILPNSWTRESRDLTLAATTGPSSVSARVSDCCAPNNHFVLRDIDFLRTRTLTLHPVALTYDHPDGTSGLQSPNFPLRDYFAPMQMVWPGRILISPRFGPVDMTDIVAAEAAESDPKTKDVTERAISRLNEAYGSTRPPGKMLGLYVGGLGGCSGLGPSPIGATNCINLRLDFTAHEAGHSLGLAHGQRGSACEDSALVGPMSQRAPINGIGLIPSYWSGGGPGRFQPVGPEKAGVFDATPDAVPQIYDYMSYCSAETAGGTFPGRTWVSTPYWSEVARELQRGGRINPGWDGSCCFLEGASDPTVSRTGAVSSPAANARGSGPGAGAAAEQPVLSVDAVLRAFPPYEQEITRVETDRGTPRFQPPTGGAPTVTVIVKDAGGGVISSTDVAAPTVEHRTEAGGDDPTSSFTATVPSSAAAARVELRSSGSLLVARNASPAAPTVKLKRPKAGTRIKGKDRFSVRWQSGDADGDPLSSRIEFSPDGGRSWETVAIGISGNSARIPGSALPRSGKKGRLRVISSDGFNVARDEVKRISATGVKPEVTITEPAARRLVVLSDTNLSLSGQAFDDRGKPITGKQLIWSSGGKRLGKGESVDAPVYRLGRSIKLTARDYAGRRSSDSLKLKLRKVAPLFTTLDASKLGKRSRKLRLQLAATVPSKLTVSGKGVRSTRTRLGTGEKRLKLRLKGKPRKKVKLKLKLKASGKGTRETLVVRRGR